MSGVVFLPVLDADFKERARRRADAVENFLDDAILAVLRENLAFIAVQPFWLAVTR